MPLTHCGPGARGEGRERKGGRGALGTLRPRGRRARSLGFTPPAAATGTAPELRSALSGLRSPPPESAPQDPHAWSRPGPAGQADPASKRCARTPALDP